MAESRGPEHASILNTLKRRVSLQIESRQRRLDPVWPNDIKERRLECAAGMALITVHQPCTTREELIAPPRDATGGAFIPSFLVTMPSDDERLLRSNTNLVRISGRWRIRPNPAYFDYEAWSQNPCAAGSDPRGFRLCCWWEHPRLEGLRRQRRGCVL